MDKIKKKVFDCFDTVFGDFAYMESIDESPEWVGYCSRDNDKWSILVGAKKTSLDQWYWDGPSFISIKEIFSLDSDKFKEYLIEYLKIKKGETRIENMF